MLMKKLITLLILFVGMVSTVSAADKTYTVVGNLDIFGSWDPTSIAGDMTKVGDKYSKTFKAFRVDGASVTPSFKVVVNHSWAEAYPASDYKTDELTHGVYDITITFDPSTNDITYSAIGRNYIVYSTDYFASHTVGAMMDYSAGNHSTTIEANEGYAFVVVPSWALNNDLTAIDSWANVICPVSDNWYDIYPANINGTVANNNNKKWYIKHDGKYDFRTDGTSFYIDKAEIKVNVNSTAEWATFSLGSDGSSQGYTVDGAEVYYVSSTDGTTANLTSIASGAKIPTYPNGILLKKVGGGEVTITTASSSDVVLTGNMLQGSGQYTTWYIDNSGYTGYYLANGSHGVGFYAAETGNMLPYRAFLKVPSGSPAREFFSLDGETTGIDAAKASQKMNGEFFNLAGQRVAQPTKGLYIVNGKKVIMK